MSENTIEFQAILKRFVRDGEDASVISFECDSSQIGDVLKVPAQALLTIIVDVA